METITTETPGTMACSECNKTEFKKVGKKQNKRGIFQLYQCRHCGRIKIGEKLADPPKTKKIF